MKMEGERVLPASRDTVWAALNNPEILRQSIPGCQSLEAQDETHLTATVGVKIGPVAAKFKGQVELQDMNPPESYKLVGTGSGGAAGSARGEAHVRLEDHPEGCKMTYNVDAAVSGKLAQLGQRMIDPVARKLAEQFFDKFAEVVATPAGGDVEDNASPSPQTEESASTTTPEASADKGGIPQWVWFAGVGVIVILALIASS
jgi:Uncharacterized conserved protein